MRRSSTETLIAACKELAATVQCDDGVANMALREIAERLEELSRWSGEPIYKEPSPYRKGNSHRVFHRDIPGRLVAEFYGDNSQVMAEQFCKMFGQDTQRTK